MGNSDPPTDVVDSCNYLASDCLCCDATCNKHVGFLENLLDVKVRMDQVEYVDQGRGPPQKRCPGIWCRVLGWGLGVKGLGLSMCIEVPLGESPAPKANCSTT